MNIFRLCASLRPRARLNACRLGDMAHLASIFILIHKIQRSRSARGISLKTQVRSSRPGRDRLAQYLYVAVFVCRYLDLFSPSSPKTVYLVGMKLFFIASSAYIVYLMKIKFRPTLDPAIDTLRLEYLVGPCAVLSLIFNYRLCVCCAGERADAAATSSKSCGRSQSTWRRSPSCRNSSSSNGRARQRRSPPSASGA